MRTFVFIDAANLFYGGKKSLGWKIDYEKLAFYLKEKYEADMLFYFGGVEIHSFNYDYQTEDSVLLDKLKDYFLLVLKNEDKKLSNDELFLINNYLQRVKFYKKLEQFGYKMFLKPVKSYDHEDGSVKRKANCDVDMTFHLMKEKDVFDRVLILSGDGDFLPVLKYLKSQGKDVIVLSRSRRTAKEIKQFAGSNFRDFEYLRELVKM